MPKSTIRLFFLVIAITPFLSCRPVIGYKEVGAGKEYLKQSNYQNAIKQFSKALEKNPDHWKAYLYRGIAYEKTNKTDHAITDFSSVLELIPNLKHHIGKFPSDEWAGIYVKRGVLYNQKNMYEQAIIDFNEALELDSSNKAAYYFRAIAEEKSGNYKKAIIDYSQTIKLSSRIMSGVLDSTKAKVYLSRANLYRRMNLLKKALADNIQALKIETTWKTFLSRGTTLSKMEKFQEAINDYNETIQLNPSAATAYLYRASSRLLYNCDLNKILDDYYSVLSIKDIDRKTLSIVYNQIAWILATANNDSIRDGKKDIEFAKKSLEIDVHFRTIDTLAVAHAERGEYEQAINAVKQAISFSRIDNPEFLPEIEKHLASFMLKKPVREECPGKKEALQQLHKWQNKIP